MAKDFSKLGGEIIRLVGGEGNIHSLVHCATRLRFVLKDRNKADKTNLEQTAGVISIVESGGQFQVVIGNNVPKVYTAIMEQAHIQADSAADLPNPSLLNRAIDFISGTFTPILAAILGGGLVKGIVAILAISGLIATDSGTYTVLNAIGDGVFYFLPLLLAVSAANKLKTNPFLAMGVAAALLYPSIVQATAGGQTLQFVGINLPLMNYTYSVIPILIAVWVQSYVQRFVDNLLHESMRNFITPAVVLLVIVPVTLLAIGPVGSAISHGLTFSINWLYDTSALMTGLVLGAVWQVLVIFGIHWSVTPIIINNLGSTGSDIILPIVAGAAVLGQTGAAFGVYLKTRNAQLKSISGPATISGMFGVTEPILYGVTLRFKKPFMFGLVGGAIGGAIIAVGGTKAFAFGFGALLGFPVIIGEGSNVWAYAIGMGVAFIVGMVLTYLFGYSDKMLPNSSEQAVKNAENSAKPVSTIPLAKYGLASPLEGELHKLNTISDPMFASEALGKGIAILPTKGELVSPINGTVSSVFPTKHAYNLVSDDGLEVLIHIGMDTVQLNGKHFESFVKDGDRISVGQKLGTFDIEAITAAGYSLMTPVIIANSDDYLDVIASQEATIYQNEPLLQAVKNNSEFAN